MNVLSIFAGLDLKAQTLGFLQERIVEAGARYYWISRAVDNRSVQLDRIRKSIGAENAFEKDLESFEEMKVVLEPIIDKV